MKRKLATLFLALCSAFTVFGFVACDWIPEPDSSVLDSYSKYEITLDSTDFDPNIAYESDTFNCDGLTLIYTAYKDDGAFYETKVSVKPEMILSGLDTSTIGDKEVTIAYGGKTFVIPYTVKYRVEFVMKDKTVTQYVTESDEIVVPEVSKVEGFEFAYWQSEIPAVMTNNIRVEAQYYDLSLQAPALAIIETVYDPAATVAGLKLPSNQNGAWEFVDKTTPVGGAGSREFEVKFVPATPAFKPIANKMVTVEVAKKQLSFKVEEGTYTYNREPQFPAYTLPLEVNVVSSLAPQTEAGVYAYTLTVDDANYQGSYEGSYTIAPKALTFEGVVKSFVYDGEAHFPTYALSDPEAEPTITTVGKSETEAGTYRFAWIINDNNYTGTYTDTYEITKPAVTVTVKDVTIVYPAEIPEIEYTVEGFENVEILNITVEIPSVANAGTYTLTPVVGNPNVIATPVAGTLQINKGTPNVEDPELSTYGYGEAAIYGDLLSSVAITSGGFGVWEWVAPETVIDTMGEFKAFARFVPQDPSLLPVERELTITRDKGIAKRPLSISVTQKEYTYTGEAFALQFKVTDPRNSAYQLPADINDYVVGDEAKTQVGEYSQQLTIENEYYIHQRAVDATLKIKQATPDVTLNVVEATVTYKPDLTLANSGIVFDGEGTDVGGYAWEKPKTALYTLAVDTPTEYTVIYTPNDTHNYTTKTFTFTVTVKRANTTILDSAGNALQESYSKSYDGSAFTFTATVDRAVAGEVPTYTYVYTDKDGKQVTPIDRGEYTLTITASQTNHYHEKTESVKVIVDQAENTWKTAPYIREDGKSWTYGSSASSIYREATYGNSTVKITYAYTTTKGVTGSYAPENNILPINAPAGEYVATVTVPETANWSKLEGKVSFTIDKASVAQPTFRFNSAYTGEVNRPTVNGTYTDGNVNGVTYQVAYSDANSTTVGQYSVTVTLDDDTNYVWSGATSNVLVYNYEITMAANSIGSVSVLGWTYGEYAEANKPVISALFGEERAVYTYYKTYANAYNQQNAISAEDIVNANVGTYYVRADIAQEENGNYGSAYAIGTATFTISNATLTGTFFTEEFEVEWKNGLKISNAGITLPANYTWDSTSVALDVGENFVKATYKLPNYNEVKGEFKIVVTPTAGEVTAAPETNSFVYGVHAFNTADIEALIEFLGVTTNHISGEGTEITFEALYNGVATTEIKNVGSYEITVKLAASKHYTASSTSVTLEITQVLNTQVIGNMSAIYGQTLNDLVATLESYNDKTAAGKWTWKTGNATAVGDVPESGYNVHQAIFTPNDPLNYAGRTVDVNVAVAAQEVKAPAASAELTFNGGLQKATVLDNNPTTPYAVENKGGVNHGTYYVIVTLDSDTNYVWTELGAGWTKEGGEIKYEYQIAKATHDFTIALDGWTFNDAANELQITPATYYNTAKVAERTLFVNGEESDSLPENAGTYTLYVTLPEDENYLAGTSNEITFTIAKDDIDRTAVENTKEAVYGSLLSAVTIGEYTELGTWSWKDATAQTTVGEIGDNTYTAVFTATNLNYNNTEVEIVVTVVRATVTLTGITNGATFQTTFDGNAYALPTVTATEDVNGTEVALTYAYTYNNNAYEGDMINAGSYGVTITLTDPVHYTFGVTPDQYAATVEIARKANTIDAFAIANLVYNGESQTPVITLDAENKDGEITYTYLVDGEYTQTVPVNAGTYEAKAVIAQSVNYEEISANTTLTVEKQGIATPSLSFTSVVYNGGEQAPTVAAHAKYDVTYSNERSENVGDYSVTLALNDDNYKWTGYADDVREQELTYSITKATVTLSELTMRGWAYEDATIGTPDVTATANSSLDAKALVVYTYTTADGAVNNRTPVGTYTITATVADTDNYDGDEISTTFTVAPKSIGQAALEMLDEAAKTYDYNTQNQLSALVAALEEASNNGEYTVSLTGETFAETEITGENVGVTAGTYELTLTEKNNNYQLIDGCKATFRFTINKSDNKVDSFTVAEKTYDGEPVKVSLQATFMEEGYVSYGYTGDKSGEGLPTEAGTYTVTVTIAATENYNAVSATANVTINPTEYDGALTEQTREVVWQSGMTLANCGYVLPENYTWAEGVNATAELHPLEDESAQTFAAVYTHPSGNYLPKAVTVSITVTKIEVTIAAEKANASLTYIKDKTYTVEELTKVTVTDEAGATLRGLTAQTWTYLPFVDGTAASSIGNAGTYTVTVALTEAAKAHYKGADATVEIEIAQAKADWTMVDAELNAKLANVTPPASDYGTWTWKNPEQVLSTADNHSVDARFEPNSANANNYVAYETQIIVSVGQVNVDATITLNGEVKENNLITFTNSAITVAISVGTEDITLIPGVHYEIGCDKLTLTGDEASFEVTNADTYTITLTLTEAGDHDYSWSDTAGKTITRTFTVGKADNKVKVTSAGWTYGEEANVVVSATDNAAGATFQYAGSNGVYSPVAPTTAGKYTVIATVAESANYAEGVSEAFEFIIEKAEITALMTDTSAVDYNGESHTKEITVTVEKGKAPVLGSTYTVTGNVQSEAGTYTIAVTLVDTTNYTFAADSAQEFNFTINAAKVNVNVSEDGFVYTNEAKYATVTLTVAEGVPAPTFNVEGNGQSNAGTHTLTITLDGTNYVFADTETTTTTRTYTIGKGENTVTVTMDGWTYGEEATSPVYDSEYGEVSVSYAEWKEEAWTPLAGKPTEAGSYKVIATVPADGNNYDEKTAEATFTVARAANSITKLTIEPWTYRDTSNAPVLEATYTEGAVYTYDGEVEVPTAAGEHTLKVVIPQSRNYEQIEKEITFNILKKEMAAPSLSVSAFYYTGEVQVPTLTNTVTETTVVWSNEQSTNAGEYTVTVTLTNDNLKWEGKDDATREYALSYKIQTATNVWTDDEGTEVTAPTVTVDGKDVSNENVELGYGQTIDVSANTKFGDVSYRYTGTTAANVKYDSEIAPTDAGSYTATVSTVGTDDYSAISLTINFVIKPQEVGEKDIAALERAEGTYTYDGASKLPALDDGEGYTVSVTKNGETAEEYVDAGTYTVTLTLDNTNYVFAGCAESELSYEIVINPVTVTAQLNSNSGVYTGETHTPTLTVTNTDNHISVPYTVGGQPHTTLTTTSANVGATSYAIKLTDNVNFVWAATHGVDGDTVTLEYEITKATATMSDADQTVVYNGKEQSANVEVTGINGALDNNSAYTVTDHSLTNVGSVKVTVTLNANGNYQFDDSGSMEKSFTFAVQAAKISLSAPSITGWTYGDFDAETDKATATASVTNDTREEKLNAQTLVKYTYKNAAGDEVDVNNADAWNAGEYTVTAYILAGSNGNYNADERLTPFTVKAKPVGAKDIETLNGMSDQNYVYNETVPTFTGGEGYTVVIEKDGASVQNCVNAGTYTISLKVTNGNYQLADGYQGPYSVTVKRASNKITTFELEENKTYDGNAPTVTLKATFMEEKYVSYSYTGDKSGEGLPTEAGTYTVTVTIAESDNYQPISKTINYVIAQAEVNATVAVASVEWKEGLTLADLQVTIDGIETKLPYKVEGGTYDWTSPDTVLEAQTYKNVEISFKSANANYADTTFTVTVIVNKMKLTVTPDTEELTYNGKAQTKGYVVKDSAGVSYTPGSIYTAEGDTATNAGENYEITLTLNNSNYTFVDENSEETTTYTIPYTIKKATNGWENGLTVTTAWDGNTSTGTVTLSATQRSESLDKNATTFSMTITYKQNGADKTITVKPENGTITLKDLATGSYTITKIVLEGDDNWNEYIDKTEYPFTISDPNVILVSVPADKSITYSTNSDDMTVEFNEVEGITVVAVTGTKIDSEETIDSSSITIEGNTFTVSHAGVYLVTIKTPKGYEWDRGGDETTIKLTVNKAENEISEAKLTAGEQTATSEKAGSWTYGSTVVPSATATTGGKVDDGITVTYYVRKDDGTKGTQMTGTPDTFDVGSYIAEFIALETDDYKQGEATVQFIIEKAPVTLTVTVANGSYYENKVTDLTAMITAVSATSGTKTFSTDKEDEGWSFEGLTFGKDENGQGADSYFTATFTQDNPNYVLETIEEINLPLVNVAYIGSGSTFYYGTVENALDAASDGDTVFVIPNQPTAIKTGNTITGFEEANVIIKENCEVKDGVILCLPYENEDWSKRNFNGVINQYFIDTSLANVNTYRRSLVTIAKGITLTLKGELQIGGGIGVQDGDQVPSGHTCDKYAEILLDNNAKIVVPEGFSGKIDCYGYIKETAYNNGSKVIVNAGEVYAPFVVYDFRGGTHTAGAYTHGSAPFNVFDMPNIQAELTISSNTALWGYADLFANDAHHTTEFKVISNNTASMIVLSEGAKAIVKYTPKTLGITTTDKNEANAGKALPDTIAEEYGVTELKYNTTFVKIIGGGHLGAISLSAGGHDVDMTTVLFPVSWKYNIMLSGGQYTIAQKMKLVSGATLTVDTDATLTLSSQFIVYPKSVAMASEDSSSVYYDANTITDYGAKYPAKPAAQLIVKGTLDITSNCTFGGTVTAGAGNAQLIMSTSNASASSVERQGTLGGFNADTVDTITETFKAPCYNGGTYTASGTYYGVGKNGNFGWVTSTEKYNDLHFVYYYINQEGEFVPITEDSALINVTNVAMTQTYAYTDTAVTLSREVVISGNYTMEDGTVFKYVFKDWYSEPEANCNITAINARDYTNGTPLYAVFEMEVVESDYTVVLQDSTGRSSGAVTLKEDEITTWNPMKETADTYLELWNNAHDKSEYLEGWYLNGTKIDRALTEADFNGTTSITLVAKWVKKYTVTFNMNLPTNYEITLADAAVSGVITKYLRADEFPYTITYNTDTGMQKYDYNIDASKFFNGWKLTGSSTKTLSPTDITLNESDANTTTKTISLVAAWPTKWGVTVSLSAGSNNLIVPSLTINSADRTTTFYLYPGQSVSYKLSNANTYTVTDGTGSLGTSGTFKASSSTATTQNTYKITAKSRDVCITPETLITLADGSQVMVKDLKGNEELLVLNHFTGKLEAVPTALIVNHDSEDKQYRVTTLYFEDGKYVEIIGEHVFFDVTTAQYVAIYEMNAESYVGHEFSVLTDGKLMTSKLINVKTEERLTRAYEIVSYEYITCFTNGILSSSAYTEVFLNSFEIDIETMGYDMAQVEADIQKYGLYTYEDFKDVATEEVFDMLNTKYLKVAVGKGIITKDDIIRIFELYYAHEGDIEHNGNVMPKES